MQASEQMQAPEQMQGSQVALGKRKAAAAREAEPPAKMAKGSRNAAGEAVFDLSGGRRVRLDWCLFFFHERLLVPMRLHVHTVTGHCA